MSEHWTQDYIGTPWTKERDCVWLFGEVQEAVFGRSVRLPQTLSALDAAGNADWLESAEGREVFRQVPPGKAQEGDAVAIGVGGQLAHIGVLAKPSRLGDHWVLHSRRGVGAVLVLVADLPRDGMRALGYYRPTEPATRRPH